MSFAETILSIEANSDSRRLISFVFERAGFNIIACGGAREGIALARANSFAAIIQGFHFSEMDGISLCRSIRSFDGATPIIFFTGETRPAKKQAALETGAQAYLLKPEEFDRLPATVIELIDRNTEKQPAAENLGFYQCKTFHFAANSRTG